MKIAILTDLFYPYQLGGAEKQFYEITARLAKKHDVHVFTLNIEGSPSEEVLRNIHIHRFGYRNSLKKRSLLSLITFFIESPFLARKLKRFDIIHANQIAAIFSFFRYILKKPFVLTIHDLYWDQWKKYYNFPFYYMGKFLELFCSKLYYNRIITVSQESERKIKRLGFSARIDIIPNGIDFDSINKIKTKKGKHIVYVGRLVNYKNVDKLIMAMREVNKVFPDIELHIIGSGNEKQSLEKMAKTNGINARFFGYLSEEEKIKEIKSAMAFVSMSSMEGFGIVLMEAMACGTPVIAKKLPAYNDFCTPTNSLLIDEGKLSETIIKLLRNTSLQKRLSENGIRTTKYFNWNNIVNQMEKIYVSLKNTPTASG